MAPPKRRARTTDVGRRTTELGRRTTELGREDAANEIVTGPAVESVPDPHATADEVWSMVQPLLSFVLEHKQRCPLDKLFLASGAVAFFASIPEQGYGVLVWRRCEDFLSTVFDRQFEELEAQTNDDNFVSLLHSMTETLCKRVVPLLDRIFEYMNRNSQPIVPETTFGRSVFFPFVERVASGQVGARVARLLVDFLCQNLASAASIKIVRHDDAPASSSMETDVDPRRRLRSHPQHRVMRPRSLSISLAA